MEVAGVGSSAAEPEVALIYPPLAGGCFGEYYPSTAVLAGYLRTRGILCRQRNLNEELAAELLLPEQLERMGAGQFPNGVSLPITDISSVAARVLERHRQQLLDDPRAGAKSALPAAMKQNLVAPLELNRTLLGMSEPGFFDTAPARFYAGFYERVGCAELSTAVVGISVPMGPQLAPAVILARYLKARRPDLKIVLGGPTLSLMDEASIERLFGLVDVDAVIRYEGEYPLESLVLQLREGAWQPDRVPGASSRRGSGFVHNPPGRGPRLTDFPFAEYDPVLVARLGRPRLGIVQARGCYWGKCSYCDFIELYEGSPQYRTRLPESFVDEMQHQIATHGVRMFDIITESIPAVFARKMSEVILQRGLEVEWISFAMVDAHFTPEVFETLARAGCKHLVVGMESMVTRVLKLVEKAGDREENIRFVTDAKRAGIDLIVNLIPDLPSTTYAEAMDGLQVLEGLRGSLSRVSVFQFEATRSSSIGRDPKRFGLKVIDDGCSTGEGTMQYMANHLEVVDPAMNDEERRKVLRQYMMFAAEINTTTALGEASIGTGPTDPDGYFRLAEEYLDLTDTDDGIQLIHLLTRTQITLAPRWQILLARMQLGPFRREWFLEQFPHAEAAAENFDFLLKHHFVLPSAEGASDLQHALEETLFGAG